MCYGVSYGYKTNGRNDTSCYLKNPAIRADVQGVSNLNIDSALLLSL
jgi:hypothetical protein